MFTLGCLIHPPVSIAFSQIFTVMSNVDGTAKKCKVIIESAQDFRPFHTTIVMKILAIVDYLIAHTVNFSIFKKDLNSLLILWW